MDERLRQALNDFLIENGYSHNETFEIEEEIPINWDNVEEFGGKKYFKESADKFRYYSDPAYLKEIPKEYFEPKTEKKNIIKAVADGLSDEDIQTLMKLANIKSNKKLIDTIMQLSNMTKEYKILEFIDNETGLLNIQNIESTLNEYAKDGWYIKSITTNEIGKNSKSIGISGISGAINSTIDQTIIILERLLK